MQLEYEAIRAFLAERGYNLSPASHGVKINKKHESLYSASERGALKAGLNHWLSGELGRHWERLWAFYSLQQFRPSDIFDEPENKAIETAIAWHEALEKEAE
jgi:hypothetical protein